MAKLLLSVKAVTPGVVVLTPAASASANGIAFQDAMDDPTVTEVQFAPGIYDHNRELFVYGKKSLTFHPGAIMRPIIDMGTVSNMWYTYGGFIHLGTKGQNNEGLDPWIGEIYGMGFTLGTFGRCALPVCFHTCDQGEIAGCFFNVHSDDVGTAPVDSVRNFIFNINQAEYKKVTEDWGDLKNIDIHHNRVRTNDNAPIEGGSPSAVAFRISGGVNVKMHHNTGVGVGDDLCVGSFCDGLIITDNYGESVAGRCLSDESQNAIIANNVMKRIATRDTGFEGTVTHVTDGAVGFRDNTALYVEDEYIGETITNVTKGKAGSVTANGTDDITATLADGALWEVGDEYIVENVPGWVFGALYGSKTILGGDSYTAHGPDGGGFDMHNRNVIIRDNVGVFPPNTASNNIGVMLGGVQNCIVEGNTFYNESMNYMTPILLYEDGVNCKSPGLPLDIRYNKNLIISDNITIMSDTGIRARIALNGIDQYTVYTINKDATGGTFDLTFTDDNGTAHLLAALPWDITPENLLLALQENYLTFEFVPTLGTRQGRDFSKATCTGTAAAMTLTCIEISYRSTSNRQVDITVDGTNLTGGSIGPGGLGIEALGNTPAPVSPGSNIKVIGNMCNEMTVGGGNEEYVEIRDNRLRESAILNMVGNVTLDLGDDLLEVDSNSSNNILTLPSLIWGMGPIRGSVGANGFKVSSGADNANLNGGAVDLQIAADCQFEIIPTSKTNFSVTYVLADGSRNIAVA